MKNLHSCFIKLALFSCIACVFSITSCSDNTTNVGNAGNYPSQENAILSKLTNGPDNQDNPYDGAGKIHNEILEAYGSDTNPLTIEGIINRVESVANLNSGFTSAKGSNYNCVTKARVDYLIANKTVGLGDIIDATQISELYRTGFRTFITTLIPLTKSGTDYQTIYSFITAYEATIIGNLNIGEKDKKIVLTTTSIVRHATFFREKKPKKNTDPDWEIMVTHIIATIDGAPEGTAKAISEALVVGITENL